MRQDFAMGRVKAPLIAAFDWSMACDQRSVLEDADLVGKYVNIENPAACSIGDAVEIAAHTHHSLMGEAPFELQHRAIGDKR